MSGESGKRQERFAHAMSTVRYVLDSNPQGVFVLIRLIAASLQSKNISSVLFDDTRKSQFPFDFDHLFFDKLFPINKRGIRAYKLLFKEEKKVRLRLGRDPILAGPWHRAHLLDAQLRR